MKTVFLDTVGLLALWESRDQWHEAARQAMVRLLEEKARLVTSSAILLECGNAAARKPYRADAARLRVDLMSGGLLIALTAEDEEEAWRDYRQGQQGEAGIVDHLSFVVMRRLGITEAFTNDRHFKTAGFTTLF